MATTPVDSWAVDLATLGPVYPFVGSEVFWVVIAFVFWIGFHVWQTRHESAEHGEDLHLLKDPEKLRLATAERRAE